MLGDSYAQNHKALKSYYSSIGAQGNALWSGLAMTEDDCLRHEVIKRLICNFQLESQPIELQYEIYFSAYFAEDLQLLAPFERDGLVERGQQGIRVTPRRRLLIHNICTCFDSYLRQQAHNQQFSCVN